MQAQNDCAREHVEVVSITTKLSETMTLAQERQRALDTSNKDLAVAQAEIAELKSSLATALSSLDQVSRLSF